MKSVKKVFHPNNRKDRPTIGIPTMEVFEQDFNEWRGDKKNTIKLPYAAFDCETFAHFHQPNMFGVVIVEKVYDASDKKPHIVGAKILKNEDGSLMEDERGKYRYVEDKDSWQKRWDRCDKHSKTKNTKAMTKCDDCTQTSYKPKNYGKFVVKVDEKKAKIRMTKLWCWDDEFEKAIVPVLMKAKVDKVYAHNATVDIIAMLTRLHPEYNHPFEHFMTDNPMSRSRILLRGSSILTCTIDVAPFYNKHNKRPYKAKKYCYKEKKMVWTEEYEIEFCDSYALLPSSLAKLGEAVGYPKGNTPELFKQEEIRYMEITDEMVSYCVRDCEVLFNVMDGFWTTIKGLGYHGTTLPLTSGTLGSQMIGWQNCQDAAKDTDRGSLYQKKEKSWKYETIINNPDLDDICREAMVGGRTQVFHSEKVETTAFGIDANSMYPAQMTNPHHFFPNFKSMHEVKKVKDFTTAVLDKAEGCVYVNWKRPANDQIGIFSHQETRELKDGSTVVVGGLDWTLTQGRRWITFPEYRHALEMGYTIKPMKCPKHKVVAVICPRLDYNPFTVIDKWYNKRKEMKANNDPNEYVLKILLNSGGFGKYVEQNYDEALTSLTDSALWGDDWHYSEVIKDEEIDESYGYIKCETPRRADTTANIMGAYITAYARLNLYAVACEIGVEHLIYCDTDSWKHTNAEMKCPYDGDELGQWKLEQVYDEWQSVAPKQYKYHAVWDEDKKDCSSWNVRVKGASLSQLLFVDGVRSNDPTQEGDKEYRPMTQAELAAFDLKGSVCYKRVIGLRESYRTQRHKETAIKAGTWHETVKKIYDKTIQEVKQ